MGKKDKIYGLLGAKLSHSYSPELHYLLGGYEYHKFEVSEDNLDDFFRERNFTALNVTIPYKKTVKKYCDIITEQAVLTGNVNTVVVGEDGRITGYNTDYDGFFYAVMTSGIRVADKKVLVLGNGGASATVQVALKQLSTGEVVVISRKGEDNYTNLSKHYDANIIINTTPVGMYPNNGSSLINLEDFPNLEGVFELIYNPSKTALLLQAERLGVPYQNGLKMLVAQAKLSSELFTGRKIDFSEIDRITDIMRKRMENILLVGMPGSGKTTVGRRLAEKTGRGFVDTDEYIEKKTGRKIPDIILEDTEAGFRRIESECIDEICKKSGMVIATGGGAVLRQENIDAMRQNSRVVFIKRDIEKLSCEGRPLSKNRDNLSKMYEERLSLYEVAADIYIENNRMIEEVAEQIILNNS